MIKGTPADPACLFFSHSFTESFEPTSEPNTLILTPSLNDDSEFVTSMIDMRSLNLPFWNSIE